MAQVMAFLLLCYYRIVCYSQSPSRIFSTSDELLFPQLLVKSGHYKNTKAWQNSQNP